MGRAMKIFRLQNDKDTAHFSIGEGMNIIVFKRRFAGRILIVMNWPSDERTLRVQGETVRKAFVQARAAIADQIAREWAGL